MPMRRELKPSGCQMQPRRRSRRVLLNRILRPLRKHFSDMQLIMLPGAFCAWRKRRQAAEMHGQLQQQEEVHAHFGDDGWWTAW